MTEPSDLFQQYLASDESITSTGSGTLLGDLTQESSIAVTDRRLLVVPKDSGFVAADLDSIHSVQSQPQTRYTDDGLRYRMLAVGGALLSLVSLLIFLFLSPSIRTFVAALVFVATAVGLLYLRRTDLQLSETPLAEVLARLEDSRLQIPESHSDNQEQQLLAVLGGFLAVTSIVALAIFTRGLSVPVLVVAGVCGLLLSEHATQHIRTLDSVGRSRSQHREVRITLGSGDVIRMRVDSTEQIDRQLCQQTGRTLADVSTELQLSSREKMQRSG